MNKNKTVTTAALVAVLILSGNAWCADQYNQGTSAGSMGRSGADQQQQQDRSRIDSSSSQSIQSGSQANGSQVMKINKASALIGTTVKNQQGEDLGKIHDLVIDFGQDKVAYAVLSTGSGVFSAQKLHAVPLRAFQPSADGTSLTLNTDKDRIARDEGFDKNNWPALGTTTFGAEPFWNDQGATESQQQQDMNRDLQKDQNKIDQNKIDSGGHGTERGQQDSGASGAAHPQQGSSPGGTQP